MTKIITIILASAFFCLQPAGAQKQKQKPKTVKTATSKKTKPDATEIDVFSDRPLVNTVFLDSIVCQEKDILENIPLPSHAGILKKSADGSIIVENEFGDIQLLSMKSKDGHYHLYKKELIGNEWSDTISLKINTSVSDLRSPFLLADGQTLYFSGRDENAANKSYNIYTSTLDTETGTFRKPTELPLPYYSASDDLFYISDEADSVAWFVTTRCQPQGSVCIYTIRTTQPWQYYDTDELEQSKFKRLAKLSSIKDTWHSEEARNTTLNSLHETLSSYSKEKIQHNVSDTNVPAKKKEILQEKKELTLLAADQRRKLSEYRLLYHRSTATARKKLNSTVIALEKSLEKTEAQLTALSHQQNP